ncbi:MAG: Lrp/AsnC family transcriptional regulator [Aigarchaeota archaeon]|nr:Lrp/AsnC family transcriptional regulator [Aigarchaeota archaeon]
MVRFTNLDIIKMLMEDSRRPYTEIARVLNVSEAAIRKRIKRLEEEGIIRKYTVEVDLRKLGYNVHVLIGIDTSPEKFIQIIERLKPLNEVVGFYTSSGDHMILLECWFKDSSELTRFVEKLGKMDGITKICPAIILEKIK